MRRRAVGDESGSSRAGSWVVTTKVARRTKLGELTVEQRRALLVERAERLVEHEQLGVVEQRPAEREPLEHPARERVGALVAGVPEPEALEQHADPLAPLGHAVEPAVEVEVLERGQLAVDERLVPEEADALALDVDVELPAVGHEQPRDQPQQRRLPGAVRAGDEQKPPRATSRSSRGARASRRSGGRAHAPGSRASPPSRRTRPPPHRKPSEKTRTCPYPDWTRASSTRGIPEARTEEGDADHAVHREERRVEAAQVARADERVLVGEQRGDDRDAEPVEDADVESEHRRRRGSQTVEQVQHPRAAEDAALAPARRPRVQALRRGRSRRRRASRRGRTRRPSTRRRRRAPRPARAGRRGSRPTPPIGASPSTAPSHRWASHVTRLRYG